MRNFCEILVCLSILKSCASSRHVWHSYQHDPIHRSREELIITNITSYDNLKLDFAVRKWESLCMENACYLAGLVEKQVVVVKITNDREKGVFSPKMHEIDVENTPVDISLFHYWNSSAFNTDVFVVVATKKDDLLWYKINNNATLFWTWPMGKNISHINIFLIEFEYHLLVINQHLSRPSADLYQFELDASPNFWLRQKINLSNLAHSSALIHSSNDHFLAIPQKTNVFIHKREKNRFVFHANITSQNVDEVVAFHVAGRSFLAVNGLDAGIYKFSQNNLRKESVAHSHTDGINYWLPISLDDNVLIAQRSLAHGGHKSFVIEMFTYDGNKFEEHEDVPCSYFGEERLGSSCLPDEEHQTGIQGAASVVLGEVLGLVVPRRNRSEFFLLNRGLRRISDPLHEQIEGFEARRREIDDLLSIQEKRYSVLVGNNPILSDPSKIQLQLEEIEKDIKLMKQSQPYKTVVFNGIVKVENVTALDQVQTEEVDDEPADTLLSDIVLLNNIRFIESEKTFQNLKVDSLFADKVNNASSERRLFSSDDIVIEGNLSLLRPLIVQNNITFIDPLDSTLHVPLNMKVNNVNGENFDDLLSQLCLKNIENYIPGTIRIKGDITVSEDTTTLYMNNVKFPEEYVFRDHQFPNMTGSKNFTSGLTTSNLHAETIDNIPTSRIITLATSQNISGMTTFKKLKITEGLNVEKNITGEHASKFLPNPTLLETNLVKAKVAFKNLTVEGAIIVFRNLNGKNLKSRLSDTIYRTEEKPIIESIKQFPEGFAVRKNLLVSSNSVNDVSLDAIVSKNGEQVVNLTSLDGIVTFEDIEVEGLYNNVDIRKLDNELVKLQGEQYISSTLVFNDEVQVKNLEVRNSAKDPNNGSIEVDTMTVEGNLHGEINNLDLDRFVKNRLSYSQNQSIYVDFLVDNLVSNNVDAYTINGKDPERFSLKTRLAWRLLNGFLKVKNFYVGGSVEIEKLNNKPAFNLGGSFWQHDVKKYDLNNLVFTDFVSFEKINIDKLSGVSFKRFVDNIVFKNEESVNLTGQKTFADGFKVKKLIETERLNSIELPNILTKLGFQEVLSPILVQGSAFFHDNVTILENIASIPIEILTNMYNAFEDKFVIYRDVLFSRLAHIQNLQVEGYANGRSVQRIVDGIVYTDSVAKMAGLVTFRNKVDVRGNLKVKRLNDVDFLEFTDKMIRTSSNATIECGIEFRQEVFADRMLLQKELRTDSVNGIRIEDWMDKGIFIDRGFLKGTFPFEDVRIVDSLHVEYINGINTSTLIPLRRAQHIPTLSFNKMRLFADVEVGNSTNSYNLPDEFENSVMIHSTETIDSELDFLGGVFVEGDVKLFHQMNNMSLDKIVTTSNDQKLHGVYNFKSKINLNSNLLVSGLVNGININKWWDQAVKTSSQDIQNITEEWKIEETLRFDEDLEGNGVINNINFREFSKQVGDKREFKYQTEKRFIDDYINICKDLTFMSNKLKKQIYKFSHLENLQTLTFQHPVDHIFNYKHENSTFLLASERKNCESRLFIFDARFRYLRDVHLGLVAQIITVRLSNALRLIVRNQPIYSTCKVQGTSLWEAKGANFKSLGVLEEQDLLQESLEPGTFYGLRGQTVTEFKVSKRLHTPVRKYRKWRVPEDNMAFVPRGLATGLAMRTGRKLIRLNRGDSESVDFGSDSEVVIPGSYSERFNVYLPGRKGSDLVVMKIGIKSSKRSLLVVTSHDETSVRGSMDVVKIYEDAIVGKLFHKVPAHKPSSLIALEFHNGETLLGFMEDASVLQLYEYKGIEGFKHKLSVKVEGSELFTMSLKTKSKNRRAIGLIERNKITFMEVMMVGNQIEEELRCL